MAKVPKGVGWLANAVGWVATVFPGVWVAVLTAAGVTIVAFWAVSIRWLESPEVHTAVFVFLASLWTVIGLLAIADRRKPIETSPKKDFRYGLTFEGLFANFDPTQEAACLQIGANLRNYSPSALRYEIENFIAKIDTRTIESGPLPAVFMPRGAGRSTHNLPFRLGHVKEFFGTRIEGTVTFSIAYGDVDGQLSRRLKMSLQTYFAFPTEEGVRLFPQVPIILGFNHSISKESDEPTDRLN